MQKRSASGTKPHKRTSGSFGSPTSAPFTPNRPAAASRSSASGRPSAPNRSAASKRDSAPLAENPYMRSSSSIYTGGERAIFSKRSAMRRNTLVLGIMGGICIIMAAVLIGFALGKDVGMAEADPSHAQTEAVQGSEPAAVDGPGED